MFYVDQAEGVETPVCGLQPGRSQSVSELQCPLCQARNSVKRFRENGLSLRMCRDCELFFIAPYPTIAQQRQRVSLDERADINLLDCARRYEGERLYYDRHFQMIAEECAGAESILDIGCGTGHLLERLGRERNLHRVGIELNPEAAELARRVSGCPIFEMPLEEFRSERRFDVVTMINVFSHVPAIKAMFASIRAALAADGKLILRTSEMSANVSRWNQLHWGVPDDLHFLGLRTLDFICKKYGFAVARHVRTPFENELFLPSRWRQMGRNTAVNLLKRISAPLPGFLSVLQMAYAAALGRRLFVSFIVLKPISIRRNAS